jgi:hypothetical protein
MIEIVIGLILAIYVVTGFVIVHVLLQNKKSLPIPKTELAPAALKPGITCFIISSRFLYECYSYLTQIHPVSGKVEWLLYVTGSKQGNAVTLDRYFELKYEKQSAAYIKVDESSSRDILIEMDKYGEQLFAVFHSHRFSGLPSPSQIDEDNQKRLERGSYSLITAIFSEDGYVTFCNSGNTEFQVKIQGKGVEDNGSGKCFYLTAIAKNQNGYAHTLCSR